MAPSRKSRNVNKKFSYVNEVASSKDGENVSKSRQRKRKLSDMLGPQWSKEELERFYEAYRKYGRDWKKVAGIVRNRSAEMVEALYTMNRAYLSLPEGTASVIGLIAMMTDHYSVLGGSDSEQESNEDIGTSRKPQKRARVKSREQTSKGSEGPLSDRLQFQSASGCLSLLKKRRTGSVPRVVGKRTPRVPISCSHGKESGERYSMPGRQGLKMKVNASDDDVAHEIALALTEASQRGGSPQVSHTPKRKTKTPSPVQKGEKMHTESDMTGTKLRGSEMDEGGYELSLGSTEADNGDYAGDRSYLMSTDGPGTIEVQQKGRRYHGKKREVEDSANNHLDDIKEACSGTEGEKLSPGKGKFEADTVDGKTTKASNKGLRKRSKKVLFIQDEGSAFDALQTLADLSLMMPETTPDTESSIQVKEEKTGNNEEYKLKGNSSIPGVKAGAIKASKVGKFFENDIHAPTEAKGINLGNSVRRKRRQKSLPSKLQIRQYEAPTTSQFAESPNIEVTDEINKHVNKGKRSHGVAPPKQGRLIKTSEGTSSSNDHGTEAEVSAPSTMQNVSANPVNLPTKIRSRRKVEMQKPSLKGDKKSSENTVNDQSEVSIPPSHYKTLNLKEKLSNCLSRQQARRWCVFEWLYSAIDYPWFAKREFVEYLDHVGLGHVPRLTRVEWGVIRSSLGKPRRFSEQFLKEEKEKLYQYRESVRKHYAELHAGSREGLPTDLARPLKVGQGVVSLHPKAREIHDGSVLTVDHSRYRIQFDRPELGVEFVQDIDCMPLNPLENLPASLMRQSISFDRFAENFNDLKMNGQPIERITEGYLKFAACENLENISSPPPISPSACHLSSSLQLQKGGQPGSNLQVKDEIVNIQQALNSQSSNLAQIQAREADVQALSELTRALDKKEAVVSELKRMNDEVMESQKDGHNSLKDSESFKKQYAAVLFQLSEVNEQVSSALFRLRQRNTYQGYQGNSSYIWLQPTHTLGDPGSQPSSFDRSASHPQEPGSHVAEIVESSRTKAQTMVDAALQAVASLKNEQSNIDRIEEAIDFVNNQLSMDNIPANPVQRTASQDEPTPCISNPLATTNTADSRVNISDQNEAQIPSELIGRCVATLLMIQKCTERQFPPGEVAQVLDSAVTSLQPCCSQNLPIYAEIQKCMGIIRNQILALIPT